MPQRHSNNNNNLTFFTYDEKRKLGFGTQNERLGKDSIKPFDAWYLFLKPLIDPLCCQKGHIPVNNAYSSASLLNFCGNPKETNNLMLVSQDLLGLLMFHRASLFHPLPRCKGTLFVSSWNSFKLFVKFNIYFWGISKNIFKTSSNYSDATDFSVLVSEIGSMSFESSNLHWRRVEQDSTSLDRKLLREKGKKLMQRRNKF